MFSLTMRALWIPLRDILSVIRIFLPLIAILTLTLIGTIYLNDSARLFIKSLQADNPIQNDLLKFITYLVSAIFGCYTILLLFDGIVKWNHKLILDERVQMINVIPKFRTWNYLGHTIFIGLCIAILSWVLPAIIILLYSLSLMIFLIFIPDATQLPEPSVLTLKIMGIMLAVIILFLINYILKDFYLRLPRISVGEQDTIFDKNITGKPVRGLSWPIALTASLILFNVIFIIFNQTLIMAGIAPEVPINDNKYIQNSWLVALITIFILLQMYILLAFTTLLSLYYKERVRPEMT